MDVRIIVELIKAAAWPITVFVLVLIFRKEISAVISRLRKGKILGQEIELEKSVERLEENVRAAEDEVQGPIIEDTAHPSTTTMLDNIDEILKNAATDPKIGIITLAMEIEKELRVLIGVFGLVQQMERFSVYKAIQLLDKRGSLPKHAIGSLKIFWELRNKIVHGQRVEDKDNIIRVLDIGMTLLRTLKAIPHETYEVINPEVSIYSDKECTEIVQDAKGVLLKVVSPGGQRVENRIYPTRKKDYKPGQKVTWEWDISHTWGECWWVDPESGDKKYAWTSAGEFVGRPIEAIH
jgi:hypothetical protein